MKPLLWLSEKRNAQTIQVQQKPLESLACWQMADERISHQTKGFFSVIGAHCQSSDPAINQQDFVLIDQPEIGILGFIITNNEILLQAKAEPGNIHLTQLSPTVQATYSNYKQLHGGKATNYLEYFTEPRYTDTIKADSLQSEQGSRFLGKFNRNMLIKLSHMIAPCDTHYAWFAISDLLQLLATDFSINTDARSVLTCCNWHLLCQQKAPFTQRDDSFSQSLAKSYEALSDYRSTVRFLLSLRERNQTQANLIAIQNIKHLLQTSVCGVAVNNAQREVSAWEQPLLIASQHEQCILICQQRSDVLYFLLSSHIEIGLTQGQEFSPTIQSGILNGDEIELQEQIGTAYKDQIATIQSDEGGRFFHCKCTYIIREIEPNIKLAINSQQRWVNLKTIQDLALQPGMMTNELRTLISLLLSRL